MVDTQNFSEPSLLKSFPNICPTHKHIIETEELSFYGFPNQPDFCRIIIEVIPDKKAIELKSVKEYLLQFRLVHISYERILQVISNDFNNVYKPNYLKIRLETKPRGGIQSKLEIECLNV
jgi:7-cyano-7-deazaguanine reductase